MGGEIDVTKSMAQLLREHPHLGKILAEKGIDCGSCLASQVDTLQDVVRRYQLDLGLVIRRLRESGRTG
ncbi:MAG: hypothetical protein HQL56_05300 [Magnetococcales bacterium]|nr:hypothetical protein [Magnetococcales bacterium]